VDLAIMIDYDALMKLLYCCLSTFLTLTLATPALAVIEITNLSDEPQTFLIREASNTQQRIVVAPQKTWRYHAAQLWIRPMRGDKPGKARQALYSDSYTYWPDGTFAIQQRRRLRGRAN
jgi:hypothetical protein